MPKNNIANLSFFEIKVPKYSEISSEAMATFFTTLPKTNSSFFQKLFKKHRCLSFEIVVWNQQIHFMTSIPEKSATYLNSQLVAQYPQALIEEVSDYMQYLFIRNTTLSQKFKISSFAQLKFAKSSYLPLKTYQDFSQIDPLSTILGSLSKIDSQNKIVIQFLVSSAKKNWQNQAWKIANKDIPTSDPDKVIRNPLKPYIDKKMSYSGYHTQINLLSVANNQAQAQKALEQVAGSFASINHPEANSLKLSYPLNFQKSTLLNSIFNRQPISLFPNHILTSHELATLYHLPNKNLSQIKNIAWGGTLSGEPPNNLPTSIDPNQDKTEINFFAKTEYKNKLTTYGIKNHDRRKHIYIIGKTGVGKSTLIANMAINDMRNNHGLAIIDPHGDLCETILDYVPKHRINDVVYIDPNNTTLPFRLNPLEVDEPEQADLVASGIVAIFHKLFSYSWGPRLEYILRNSLLTLCQVNDTTLLDVPRLLTSSSYRQKIIDKIDDPVLQRFWLNEFNALDERDRNQAISPILNKVGQFTTSPKIRLILERPHSSISLKDIMNNGKILIINLSQGKIGEDNAALLGAMFITKIQLAAMSRVSIPENQRRDFYLYVDEFQNFATSSFIKILSEARKYRLNLIVANQYTAQVELDVQKAIFGNIGTLISFLVGAQDAHLLNEEFGQIYQESDLVSLNNFEIINKLSIDNQTCLPFPAITLPLPKNKSQHRDKIIKVSAERYGRANSNSKKSDFLKKDNKANISLSNSKTQKPPLKPKSNYSNTQQYQAHKAIQKLANLGVLKSNPSPSSSTKPSINSQPQKNRPQIKVEIED